MSGATRIALPLAGRRVLVTRARRQASELSDKLRDLGAEVVELPVIEIVAAPPQELDEAIGQLDEYDWVVFTSVNAVAAFCDRLDAAGASGALRAGGQVAAIGPATAARLRGRGIEVSLVPERFVAESLVEALAARRIAGRRVLLPRARIARDTLPDGLRAAGALVDVVVAYETRLPEEIDKTVVQRLRAGDIDVITFASPSAVRNLADLLEGESPPVKVACIGPITAAAAWESGFSVAAEAAEYSISGLVEAVVALASLADGQGGERA
jgi:uroporphyrinogen III methyltransferase/synthase